MTARRTLLVPPLVLLAVLAAAAPPALAADPAPPAGFVDGAAFARLASEDGELVEVNVSQRILQALANSFGEGEGVDPALGRTLAGLHSIRAIVAEIEPGRAAEAAQLIERTAADLAKRGWEEIARVRSGSEKVRVLGLPDGGKFGGLTVMMIDAGDGDGRQELVFANIAGPFDLSQIDAIGRQLNVPGLRGGEAGEKPEGEQKKGKGETERAP